VDLGMGNPDSPTPPHIVAKMIEAVQDPRTHRYSMSKGIPGLRKALAGYYDRRFGVKLNPETEVVATLGSKEGLANLAQAISSPGDTILVPNPSYPIHQFGFIIAGASARFIPYTPDDEMLAAIDRAVRHSVPKPTALIVNFPSNPTAFALSLRQTKSATKSATIAEAIFAALVEAIAFTSDPTFVVTICSANTTAIQRADLSAIAIAQFMANKPTK
jgi:alanine-synthesizing transaminase